MSKPRTATSPLVALLVFSLCVVMLSVPAAMAVGGEKTDISNMEPGQTESDALPQTAENLSSNASVAAEITENDVDWFQFEASVGNSVVVNLTRERPQDNLEVALLTTNGEQDSQRINTEETSGTVADTVEANTTYYVRVRGGDQDAVSRYQLDIRTLATDNFEPNQNRRDATPMSINSSLSGEITKNDVDWFTFASEAGERVRALFTRIEGTDNLVVSLYEFDQEIDSDTLTSGETSTSVGDTPDAQTQYYVRVSGSDSDTVASYRLGIRTNSTDSFEPNENRLDAVNAPGEMNVSGEISENDIDWFAYDARAGDRVRINATKRSGLPQLDLTLFTFDGEVDQSVIALDQQRGFVADTADRNQTYYVRVSNDDRDVTPYNLQFERESTEQYEPNERATSSHPLAVGENLSGIVTENDVDWFFVQADASERILVDLTKPSTAEALDLELRTFNEQRDQTQIEADQADGFVADTSTTSQTYFVRVSGDTDDVVSPYTLNVTTNRTLSPDNVENQSRFASLEPNSSTNAEITENDVDWFTFEATTGDRVTANLTKEAGRSELEVDLFTADDTVDSVTVPQDRTAGVVADTADTPTRYYVRVQGSQDFAVSPYTLTVETQPTEAYEPNELGTSATAIETGANVSGVVTENDVDWFTFDADTGQRASVNVSRVVSRSELEIDLFTPQGRVDRASIPTDEKYGFVADTASASTTYYVRVQTRANDGGSPYRITASIRATDAFEENNEQASATAFNAGERPTNATDLSG